MKTVLVYDGSFKGLLTAVYRVFEEKLEEVVIVKRGQYQSEVFSRVIAVNTDSEQAGRVWSALRVKAGKQGSMDLYKAFLGELKGTENAILKYIAWVYRQEAPGIAAGDCDVSRNIRYAAGMVARSEARCAEFVAARLGVAKERWVSIHPDFNVLPLIVQTFKQRWPDRSWIIYDSKRKYGFHCKDGELLRVDREPFAESVEEQRTSVLA